MMRAFCFHTGVPSSSFIGGKMILIRLPSAAGREESRQRLCCKFYFSNHPPATPLTCANAQGRQKEPGARISLCLTIYRQMARGSSLVSIISLPLAGVSRRLTNSKHERRHAHYRGLVSVHIFNNFFEFK